MVGIATVSPLSSGVSTIRSTNPSFPGNIVKENDLIQYSDTTPGLGGDPIIGRVTSVGTTDSLRRRSYRSNWNFKWFPPIINFKCN